MRIIGGKFRGRKIKHPGPKTVRSTKDMVRESVFNIIAEKVPGSRILDIFAGSGAYGLEALSRGAESAVFIEKDRTCCETIKENIHLFGLETSSVLIPKDAFKAVESLSKDDHKFDIIFSDPPYNKDIAKKILIMINHYDILNNSGFFVVEHHRSERMTETEGSVSLCKQKTYGDILISVYLKNDKKSDLPRNI